jgi:UDP-glucose 4-epimerase
MILVTGGAGYIGSHIVKELLKQKYEVIVLDNLSTGNTIPCCKLYKGDITSVIDLIDIFTTNKIELVIHCAASLDITESIEKPLEYYNNNVYGTLLLLRVMQQYGVNKIIFSSTACLYKDGLAKETDEVVGHNPYASSKLTCEDIIKYSGIKYVIFRYFNVAGNDKQGKMLIQRIKQGENITIYGNDYETRDGTCIRDYIHVEDIAKAHIKAIEYLKDNDKGLFNLGTNEGYTIKEICDMAEIKYTIGSRRESDVIISIADNTKAKEILKWYPEKTLKDILRR